MMKRNMIRGGGDAAPNSPQAPLLAREGKRFPGTRGEFGWGILLFLFLVACSSTKPTTTDESASVCAGRCGMAEGVQCGPCGYGYACNEKGYCVEIEGNESESVGRSEEESSPDEEKDEHPDADRDTYDPDCPPLLEAQFPFYREDGTIHFCRKCDTPTEKDPQCVQNLWRELNQKLAHDHPDVSCYPYPCEMPSITSMTKEEVEAVYTTYSMHECDLMLNEYGWVNDSTGGQIKHWNLSGGKIGFLMDDRMEVDITKYAIADQFFLYDTSSTKYSVISPSEKGFVYQNGKALLYFRDSRSFELGFPYIYVGYFGTDGTYRVVFDKPIYSILYTPALNEKWAFANINFVKNGTSTMYYAKVGEWKWTALGQGVAYYPDVKGDMLGFYDSGEGGYICDLSQKPTSVESCRKVNREGEPARDIVFDKERDGIAAYTNLSTVFLVRYDKDPMERTELFSDYTGKAEHFLGFIVNMLRGDVLSYTEVYFYGGDTYGGRACFYRLDTKKRYCMNKMEDDKQYSDGTVVYPYGDAEFEGKWFLYQKQNNSPLILRDMDCYCAKEGVCPFEGLKR